MPNSCRSVERKPASSANGRFVAFLSLASNLVRSDHNHRADVFIHDRKRGKTTRVGVSSTGAEANDGSVWRCAISGDGRFVAFFSGSTNLVPNDHNGIRDFFVRDLKRGKTTRVISSAEEEQIPGSGVERLGIIPALSHNGSFVAFFSASPNLVPNDHNDTDDIFVRDRKRGETTRVSVSSAGAEPNDDAGFFPSISANGRFVAFESPAPDLVKGDRNEAVDVFLHDGKRGKTTLLSVSSEGTQGNSESSFPAISANGRFVAFSSLASSLVEGERHNTADTFVRGPLL